MALTVNYFRNKRFIIDVQQGTNPLSANPTKWSNKLKNSLAKADELFECV